MPKPIYQIAITKMRDGRYAAYEIDHSFWEFGTTREEALAKLQAAYPRYEFHVQED